jgi:hypothetical protein
MNVQLTEFVNPFLKITGAQAYFLSINHGFLKKN